MDSEEKNAMEVQTLAHRRSSSFVQEYADRQNLLVSDNKQGVPPSITIVFGRDVAEILEESATQNAEGKMTLIPSEVVAYRLDVASITIPESSAKSLGTALLQVVDRKKVDPEGA